jgi:cell division protein FtsB
VAGTRQRRSRSFHALRWLGLAVILAIAVAYVHPIRAYQGGRERVAGQRAEIDALARENARLTRRLADADTEAFVVREARKLGLVRPGERLFIVKGAVTEGSPGIR